MGNRFELERLLGVPEMEWFIARVRSRITLTGVGHLHGVLRLNSPTDAQREAAMRLVGKSRRPGSSLRIDLDDVEAILRAGPWPEGLADAVIALTGPVVDHREDAAREIAEWDRAASGFSAVYERYPILDEWWLTLCATGNLKRSARSEAARLGIESGPSVAEQLVSDLVAVLGALPASGVPLSVFARNTLGDAHGLDETRPLGRLATAALRLIGETGEDEYMSRRDAWAAVGVVLSNVASTVLSLGLRGASRREIAEDLAGATAVTLDAMHAVRSPVVLTLDQVRSGGVSVPGPIAVVHVTENPAVIESIAQHWASDGESVDPLMVCSSGQPSTAVIELLEWLTQNGAKCRYHGDFDWAGIRIAQSIGARVPWRPWRFTACDYREAAESENSSIPLRGTPAETPWDPDLTVAMREIGRAVEEEAVVDLLADDVLNPPF